MNNVQELGTLANSMTRDYSALAGDCRGAVAASANPQVSRCSRNVTMGWRLVGMVKGHLCVHSLPVVVTRQQSSGVQFLISSRTV